MLGHFVILQQSAMQFRLHYLCPADALGEAELLVLQPCHTSGTYRFKRAQLQRVQRSLGDVKCGKILHQLQPPDRFQVAEFRVRHLEFEESRDSLKSREDFQLVQLHGREARTKHIIVINLFEFLERLVEERDRSFNNGAIPEA